VRRSGEKGDMGGKGRKGFRWDPLLKGKKKGGDRDSSRQAETSRSSKGGRRAKEADTKKKKKKKKKIEPEESGEKGTNKEDRLRGRLPRG